MCAMKFQNMEDEIPWAQCEYKPPFKHKKKKYNHVHIAHGSNHTWQTT